MAGVRFEGVTKRYGEHVALRSLDLDVADGELLVVLGPSGSGKTTALRLIAGLQSADAGRLWIGERDVTATPPDERDIAMVFQSYALFPHMTVYENLAFGLRARKRPPEEVKERVESAAMALGVQALLERKPRQLSGGERQRVALGRAIVREPSVFLMDEPLSNLDARLRVQTRAEIQRLQASLGVTTIYVTHDQVEALGLGHRVAVLDEGVLQQLGTPHQVYDTPANVFVAGFMGSPPMNLIDAVVFEGGAVRWGEQGSVTLDGAPVHPGERVTLGVRPEHVHLQGSAWSRHDDGGYAQGRVDVVSSAGDQTIVLIDAAGALIAARAEPAFSVRSGDTIGYRIVPGKTHLFDRETGVARWHA